MAEVSTLGTRNREYKDISLTFARNPVTNDITAVVGADAVKRAVRHLLMTFAGEVPFFPNFGSSLHRLLFEPINILTTVSLESEIRTTILAYEPRVTIQSLIVTPTEDELRYQIDLTFRILNTTEPVQLTLFLTRLR